MFSIKLPQLAKKEVELLEGESGCFYYFTFFDMIRR